jgi:hypothetical protein
MTLLQRSPRDTDQSPTCSLVDGDIVAAGSWQVWDFWGGGLEWIELDVYIHVSNGI